MAINQNNGVAPQNLQYVENFGQNQLVANGVANSTLSFQRMQMPGQISATQVDLIGHITGNSGSSGALTFWFGLYTMTGSTANSASTFSQQLSWTSNSNSNSSGQYGGQSGTRYRTLGIGTFNITPGE